MNDIHVKQFFFKLISLYYIKYSWKIYTFETNCTSNTCKLTYTRRIFNMEMKIDPIIKKNTPHTLFYPNNSIPRDKLHNTRNQFKLAPRVHCHSRRSAIRTTPNLETRLAKSTRWTRSTHVEGLYSWPVTKDNKLKYGPEKEARSENEREGERSSVCGQRGASWIYVHDRLVTSRTRIQ